MPEPSTTWALPAWMPGRSGGRWSRGSTDVFAASPGLDPGAHVFVRQRQNRKTWMAGSSPAKADERSVVLSLPNRHHLAGVGGLLDAVDETVKIDGSGEIRKVDRLAGDGAGELRVHLPDIRRFA